MALRIRQERIDREWTQKHVAQKMGITESALQRIETGKRKPSYKVLVKLEALFNLTHQELFAVVNDEEHNSPQQYHKKHKKVKKGG